MFFADTLNSVFDVVYIYDAMIIHFGVLYMTLADTKWLDFNYNLADDTNLNTINWSE